MTTHGRRSSETTELLALAEREHRAGRLVEAAAACRQILTLSPDNAETHNNLGVILAQQGKFDEAFGWFERAVALRPDYVEGRRHLSNVLLSQGHGLVGQNRLDEAAAYFERALTLSPGDAQTQNVLGNLLWKLGQIDAAAARFEQAVALEPHWAEAHNNLGIALARQGHFQRARARFEQAVALRPDYVEAHNNLGNVLDSQGELQLAQAYYVQALALKSDHVEARANLANVLWKQGKHAEAAAHCEYALALAPDFAEAHFNLANVLESQGRLDDAAARFRRAIALRPDYVEAHNNLANLLVCQGQFAEAAAHYRHALALRPNLAESEVGLAACCLVQEDYQNGWPAYEARLRLPGVKPLSHLPRWSGQDLAGRSLLVVAEQGLGDTLQFVRYAGRFKALGARVVLAVPAALRPLLASQAGIDELFVFGSTEPPRADFYLPLLSAPLALGTTTTTIPGPVPYLAADPGLIAHWRQSLAQFEGFKIGIVWQGSRGFSADRWRSMPLAEFEPLARIPGVRLLSLQKGFGAEQIAAADFPVVDLASRLDDTTGPFVDTAAVIANLDLVVTPDTAIAHLAGALGAPVFLALQWSANWRWLEKRDDSPWYPTMRLFRQTTLGRWADVVERMAAAIQDRRGEGHS